LVSARAEFFATMSDVIVIPAKFQEVLGPEPEAIDFSWGHVEAWDGDSPPVGHWAGLFPLYAPDLGQAADKTTFRARLLRIVAS
jgi:hypothetical protein